MTALLIPCNCECHETECHANHGFNGAYSSYCSGCDSVYEYQAECGCCLNAEIGDMTGPAAIHRAVNILAEAARLSEIDAEARWDALASLDTIAYRMCKTFRPGAQGARDLVTAELDALEVAA